MRISNTTDTVRPHTLIRNAVLCGQFLFIRPFGSGDGGIDLLPLCAIQSFFCGQFDAPPVRAVPAVQARHNSYLSYKGAVSVSENKRE